ncbi:hypothetical protein PshuTeo2_36800 [Pseudomonas hunanensis]|nr:hypothetical protein [Pseudomonas hunanensis]
MKLELFRKGQVVPRRLRVLLATIKGAQHFIRFGVDCTWDGSSIRPAAQLGPADYLIEIGRMSRPMKNGTRIKSGLIMSKQFGVSICYESVSGKADAVIEKQEFARGCNP